MSTNVLNKDNKRNTMLYAIITFVLLCAIFFSLIVRLYTDAEVRAMESLHIQTKQIKDDLSLQIMSDRENLATMANFASKLYLDGDDYSLLFNSFKPIGLIENIGILNPDNTFITKTGSMDLSGLISFEDEAKRDAYISGRVTDLTLPDNELVRTAVPIVANNETIGVLYGVIKLEKIKERYIGIANELNAQLFVYDSETGNLIVDSIHDELGNISFLKDRVYNKGYSYEDFDTNDNGFSSFRSAYRDEGVLLHYSSIEDFSWKIALVRYDSQLYAETHNLLNLLLIAFGSMIAIMSMFVVILTYIERRKNKTIQCASNIRRILIEASGIKNNISDALKEVSVFVKSRSAVFFDSSGEDYSYIAPEHLEECMSGDQKQAFKAELFRYVSSILATKGTAIRVARIKRDKRLEKSNPSFYAILNKHQISELIFSATVNHLNHTTILCVITPKRRSDACYLAEKISACFTIALSNQTILSKTRLAATTDSLTGVLNRVAYNNDLQTINEEKPFDFSCIYIDVNELHWRNNKFGHAAGDEMLLFIAHTLKDVFFGHKIYRLGGDEFLVFCQDSAQEDVKKGIDILLEQLKPRDYHVAIGMSFRSQNTNVEEMVREAEIRMYEAKAKYYQNKERHTLAASEKEYIQTKTGISEIDTMLSVLKENYTGIYRVSLDTDKARRVLMPSSLNYNETEEHFSKLFAKYISNSAKSDYHRALLSFQNYDALKQQISEGIIPKITYKRLDGETITLSVYKLCDSDNSSFDTLWIFAKK